MRTRGAAWVVAVTALFGGQAARARSKATAPLPPVPLQSGPIAISQTGRVLVNVNPDEGTLSVFKVDATGGLTQLRRIKVGADPSSVAIDAKGRFAWVA